MLGLNWLQERIDRQDRASRRRPEAWDEDKTRFSNLMYLKASTFNQTRLFDVEPSDHLRKPDEKNIVRCPGSSFAYYNQILPAHTMININLAGGRRGRVWFDKNVVIPTLSTCGPPTRDGEVVTVWMSMTPTEILSMRLGIALATGTVVIGGLGLGYLLRKVCAKKSVTRVIVVEKDAALLAWIGDRLRGSLPGVEKVTDWIPGDVYDHVGVHGPDARHLLDIWPGFGDKEDDRRFAAAEAKAKHIWGWG